MAVLALAAFAQTANPPSLGSIQGAGGVELGQNVMLGVVVYGTSPGLAFQWRKDGADLPGATLQTYEIAGVTAAATGTYAVAVSNSAGTSVASAMLTVKPASAPVTASPPRDAVVQVGQATFFSATFTGSFPRTYQWMKDGMPIAGATATLFKIEAASVRDAGVYTLVATNAYGSVTTPGAALTVNAATPVMISNATPADITVVQGTMAGWTVSLTAGSQPLTYQWLKNGSPIAGATNSQLQFSAVALTDAARYSVVVSNPAGSATSREATLTVTPATLATFSSQPVAQAVYQGQNASFSFSLASGSQPMTFQWYRNGAAVTGATYATLSLSAVTLNDAGNYTVTVTNAAGAVTSTAAALTVTPASAPTIIRQPAGKTVPYGDQLTVDVGYAGTPPLTFTWKKDGVAVYGFVTNAPDFSVFSARPSDSGTYTVTISNVAGSVTSSPAVVTVSSPALPIITQQPASLQVAAGLSATFNVQFTSVGAGDVAVQWLKNGTPIPGANSSANPSNARTYYIPSTTSLDEGDYTVTLTGLGGSVTSATAHLTVLSAAQPYVRFWPNPEYVSFGETTALSVHVESGSLPLAYQWYKDGVSLAGQTNSLIYLTNIQEPDLGLYTVTVSNSGGVIASPPIPVRLYASIQPPWVAAEQQGNVIYFLVKSPSRIERYDVAGEKWLPTVSLTDPRAPTAMLPTTEGVYLAYGRTLVKRTLDLATETPILNPVSDIVSLFTTDQYLYYTSYVGSTSNTIYTTASVNRASLQSGGVTITPVHYAAFAPGKRVLYGMYDRGELQRVFPVDGTGTLGSPTVSILTTAAPTGSRAFIFPGEQYVANGAGTILRLSDLSYAGSLGERPNDLTFFGNGTPVVLRNRLVQTIDANTFATVGSAPIPFLGWRAFISGDNVFVFGSANATGPFQVAKVARASIVTPTTPTGTLSSTERYSVDDAFLGDDGVVHVYSRSKAALLRWSASSGEFLSVLPLRALPSYARQTSGSKRALIAYADGQITEVPLKAGSAAERQVAAVGALPSSLSDMGGPIAIVADRNWWLTVGTDGQALYSGGSATWWDMVGWNATKRRLYSTEPYGIENGTLQYETVPATGVLPSSVNAANKVTNATSPIRMNLDGNFIVTGNGRVLNEDLTQVGVLANDIVDAAWLPSDLYTLRSAAAGTEVQRWNRSNYLLSGTVTLAGSPIRLFALSSTQVVAVTASAGRASITLLNADLTTAAHSSTPNVGDIQGTYIGTINSTGSLALYIRPDRTGVLIAHVSMGSNVVATDIKVDASNAFRGTGRDLLMGSAVAIAGFIQPDGSISGTIGSTTTVFTGAKTVGSTAPALYSLPAINGGTGIVYAIIGANGTAMVLAQGNAGSDTGTGSIGAGGIISVISNAGIEFTISPVGTNGSATASGKGVFAGTAFAGLRDDVPRTDRLANISTRGPAGAGDATMIAGFVIRGTAPRAVLIRAIGPGLAGYGVSGFLADPRLDLYSGETKIAMSDNWGSEAGAASVVSAATRVGAFSLPGNSMDAALFTSLAPGNYTVQATGNGSSTGVALIEVYDAGDGDPATAPRLLNISTRGFVGSGTNALIAGFVVTGNAPKRLLVRAVGPSLARFGVGGTLPSAVLQIFSGPTVLASNDGWGSATTSTAIAGATTAVGAFPLTDGSMDAALLVTLPPGNYTAQATGRNGATGVALVEVYEAP